MCLVGEAPAIIELTFDECPMTLSKTIDVLPGARRRKGELVGSGTNNGSVFFVQCKDFIWLPAAEKPVRMNDIAPGGEERAREAIERMRDMLVNLEANEEEE